MALESCFECRGSVAETAEKCPHCGAHNPTQSVGQHLGETIIGIGIMVGLVFLFVWAANSGLLPEAWVDWLVDKDVLSR